jgi:hypothetical protein
LQGCSKDPKQMAGKAGLPNIGRDLYDQAD